MQAHGLHGWSNILHKMQADNSGSSGKKKASSVSWSTGSYNGVDPQDMQMMQGRNSPAKLSSGSSSPRGRFATSLISLNKSVSELSSSSEADKLSARGLCCKHSIQMEGLRAQHDFTKSENKLLRHRIKEQEDFTREQEKLLKSVIQKFKTDKREARTANQKEVNVLNARIARLETQLREAERANVDQSQAMHYVDAQLNAKAAIIEELEQRPPVVEERKAPKMVTKGCQTNMKKPAAEPAKEESKQSASVAAKQSNQNDKIGFAANHDWTKIYPFMDEKRDEINASLNLSSSESTTNAWKTSRTVPAMEEEKKEVVKPEPVVAASVVEAPKEVASKGSFNPKDRFKCMTCHVSFSNKAKYAKHVKTKEHKMGENSLVEKAMVSEMCRSRANAMTDPQGLGIPFEQCEALQIWPYGECYACNLGLISQEVIGKHAKNAHGGVSFPFLPKYSQEISNVAWLVIYANDIPNQTSRCNYCAYECNNKASMMLHIIGNHRVLIQCSDCDICIEPQLMETHKALNCNLEEMAKLM